MSFSALSMNRILRGALGSYRVSIETREPQVLWWCLKQRVTGLALLWGF